MVEYQVLLATIPQVGSENYTIRCYGNPESPLDLCGSHTYGTTKINNLIYLGESRHGDTFYTIDTNTKELTSLSYVNDALYAQAKSYLTECGFGTEFALSSHVVCKSNGCTVFSADISSSVDNSPTYFTVYHAYIGSNLLGKVILRHLIPFYDAINESHVNAMYIHMDDVIIMAKEQFEAFYTSKGYTQPYKITSIHMTSFESIEVEFLISESDNFDIYTEAEVDFTYNFEKELWEVSRFRETPPDYLSSFLEFPELTAEDVVVTGKDWCLTFLDETELPRFQELMDAGGELSSELIDSRFPEEGSHYIITLDGIGYYFYSNSAPELNHQAWNVYLLSPDHPLSGGAKVGMTEQELLALYPDLAKTTLSGDDPAFNGTYGSDWFAFRNDQFPESFLKEYDYAYVAYLDKERDGLPVCIAFLMRNGQVGAITVYMPTAG